MKRLSALVAVLAIGSSALIPAAAAAQERPPEERLVLGDLAYVIGEAHALRQACEGEEDQYWRARMVRLSEVEAADAAFDSELKERFNTGFHTGQAEHPTCDARSRAALAKAALKGQALSAKLSVIIRTVTPPPPPDPYAVAPEPKPPAPKPPSP